ncbi:MAG TPA: efflux RND transporter periplasmic adaptor subunit [Phycisphaerae bacterium]|nr:efflux RND transporter periplasmic adaptor subunit [Phycisphaerae bacterium]HRW51704.1 efflux RND transporter periplasmic adaptor subunit [Phycisphaerae bacterium]
MTIQGDLKSLTRDRSPAKDNVDLRAAPPKRRLTTRLLLPGAILSATLGILGYSSRETLRSATEVEVAPVIAKVEATSTVESEVVVQAPGWLEPDPFPVAVSALADGVIREVLVLEGDRVTAGQVVARLIDDDARIAMSETNAQVAEAEAMLASAKSLHEEAQRNWEHPIELTRRRDALVAQLAERRAELARWPSEVASEEAAATSLKADLERIAPLREGGRASEIEYVHARQAFEAQQAEVVKARLREAILIAQIAGIEADLAAAREQLELRIADRRALTETAAMVRRAEASLARTRALRDKAALALERMEIRSAANGVVMARLVAPGAKLMLGMDNPQSAQAIQLYDPEKLQVRVDVPLADAAKVAVGHPAEVIVNVLPDQVFKGRITRVVHQADVQKNTLQMKVAIEDPTRDLKPEMLARVRFTGDAAGSDATRRTGGRVLYVPRGAVSDRSGDAFVWIADTVAGASRRVSVRAGRETQDGYVEVSGHLRIGDRVIVDAPDDLSEGEAIRVISEAKESRDGAH